MRRTSKRTESLASFIESNSDTIILFLVLALFSLFFFAEVSILSFASSAENVPFSWSWFLLVIATLFLVLKMHLPSLHLRYSYTATMWSLLIHLCILLFILISTLLFLESTTASFLQSIIWYLSYSLITLTLVPVVVGGNFRLLRSIVLQIWISLIIGSGIFGIIQGIHALWPIFSFLVANLVFLPIKVLFPATAFYTQSSTYQGVVYENVPTVGAEGFGGVILKTCSGVDGLTLFFLLFTFLILLEWKRIVEKWKIAVLYLAGMITMFSFNVLRVFLLILAGIRVSPEFATGALHSNLGWIFFTLVFIFFEFVSYRWMVKR